LSLRNANLDADVYDYKMENRTLTDIRQELQAATERRAELWHELSNGSDPEKAAEVARLSERIEALWSEARAAKNRARWGESDAVLRRARAEERLERDLAKVA
jgi:hypothetical protein